jgi:RHH-type proline utilization regulon transcriptional repressor/proline dehydrogenase/delta 1-pyrroline-5-carboxylate dehydrogenase
MSGVFDITSNQDVFDRERMRFETSLRRMDDLGPSQNRTQNRLVDKARSSNIFTNAPDTDPALPNNRDWIRQVLAAAKQLEGKLQTHESHVAKAAIETYEIEELVTQTRQAAVEWSKDSEKRKELLLRVGAELANSRGALLQFMIAEAGKTFAEADAELSEAVDFANFYAHSIDEITTTEKLDGVTFIPHKLVVVTPPWNFPVAIAAGGVLAALAAGAAVIIKPAPQVVNCVIAMVETLWRAGIPKDVLRIALVPDNELGLQLVGHTQVDSVILTGSFETAQLFKSYRPRMNLAAETSGKNAIVITPFADLDLAANDLAKSAFGHAGQKCSAASLGILVGSVYKNKQFLKQLVDCVESMKVGYGSQADATVGPLIEPPTPKLLRALTTLEPGEQWLLEPKQLDESGRLWRPGIKLGVKQGSFFHLTEVFGPVLGLIEANDLEHALEVQNGTEFGLTAGIHSLNIEEIKEWLNRIEAGNLYVNRGITGAIVERQPFGGFKRSAVGYGLKAGGRNYLLQFGHFEDSGEVTVETTVRNTDWWREVIDLVEPDKLDWLHQAIRSDEYWSDFYVPDQLDSGDLVVEGNYHRYLADDGCVVIRVSQSATKVELARLVVAMYLHGATISIDPGFQSAHGLTDTDVHLLAGRDYGRFAVETEDEFIEFMSVIKPGTKLIIVGSKEAGIAALQENPDLFVIDSPITKSGRATQLAFYREQSISITQHRFGAIQQEMTNILERE